MKKYALISVSNKKSIIEFAKELIELNYTILATGNTAKHLIEFKISCIDISDFTSFPEIFNGRVKTLNPKIFGGILFRRDYLSDKNEADVNKIEPIDIVCVNLYPFKEKAENPATTIDELIENIDIGGPSLIRAAAKNYKYVSVLTNPDQYQSFIEILKTKNISVETNKQLALDAFAYTSNYDTFIANTLENKFELQTDYLRFNEKKIFNLRYGENPHQSASLYGNFFSYFNVLHGKEISYNNILDINAAAELIEDLEPNSAAIIKHNNPSGAATSFNLKDAYTKALACDPISAFGGIVILNSEVDEELSLKLNEIFLEAIIAPSFSDDAISILKKKKDRRLVQYLKSIKDEKIQFRSIPGGIIKQTTDNLENDFSNLKFVTEKKCSENELQDLKFAWAVCKNAKSNAIIFARDKQTLGIGAGQVSRIDSVKIAINKAKDFGFDLHNSVVASDAFFPFDDAVAEFAKHKVAAVIQPGGSIRDSEVIETANKNNISMVFTGIRHFKH